MRVPRNPFQLATFYLLLGLIGLNAASAAILPEFYPEFDLFAGRLPFPNDLLFTGSTDGTLNIPVADPNNPADPRVALNELDGFSTVAPVTARFSGAVDADTLKAGRTVRVFEVTLINPFLDPTHPAPFFISTVKRELTAGGDYAVGLSPADSTNATLTIAPLRPLAPKTGYLVVLTDGIYNNGRFNAAPSPLYRLAKQETPLVNAGGDSAVPGVSDSQARTLEALRQLINNQENAAASQGINKGDIVLSWTFMTQSIDDAFAAIDDAPKPQVIPNLTLKPTGSTTAAVGLGLPGYSDIHAGVLAVPFYLDKDKPLSGRWRTAADGPVTRYNPLPAATATAQLPALLTVPNAASGQRKPASGWPVVIFQHGITQNRTNLFLIADALAFAGFAAVAIDLPLHGITDKANPFYLAGLERTFDLDLTNNATGAEGPDGAIDASGSYFINLRSLLTSRDNLRQAVEDLRQLAAALPVVDLDGDRQPDLDPRRIHFVGHSLGGIAGTTFLGVDATVTSATLAMPGGGIAKLLDASPTFGPRIAAGLAAAGLAKGTPDYESYLVAAQTTVDSGDPINYGATAAARHPIHLIEVAGGEGVPSDRVIPNTVAHAPLSGTEPLASIMALQALSRSAWDENGLRAIVRFTRGDHGSIINPTADVGTTAEMQGQLISFLKSAGTELEITYHPVVK
ncbi:MAG: Ig-like domain-containing protein [Candidatus Competibacteraceae bacterium]|nr:Ig-like domain-containing protein [Candidatus Competibacteraceae bacterium]